ncbi:hypothetical protein OJ997_10435 [Solirubrobacter phytolaccae]|uniref:Uncharacterized protein n=1 Tax=Solirubrobacter phytolaccae TaxID=1404360 RepID=A0A9X3SAW5_9ACTN|nr:hypothetical protein [Solirubrobacter phytolaccae]MDA0180710.1 hypothetical protein [Solirubrobacter phytolaccae]
MPITEHPLGLTWVADDALQRAAHALAHDGKVWLVDPFEQGDAIERAAALGEVAGVLQLFVAHERDGKAIADRLDAPFFSLPSNVPDAPFDVVDVSLLVWKERALWWPERRGLVVAESIGTAPHLAVGPGPAGVHPLRRGFPPAGPLKALAPEHLLVGHGHPVHGPDATTALQEALHRSRRDIPTLVVKLPGIFRSMQGRR